MSTLFAMYLFLAADPQPGLCAVEQQARLQTYLLAVTEGRESGSVSRAMDAWVEVVEACPKGELPDEQETPDQDDYDQFPPGEEYPDWEYVAQPLTIEV